MKLCFLKKNPNSVLKKKVGIHIYVYPGHKVLQCGFIISILYDKIFWPLTQPESYYCNTLSN